jgi:hypothetical protein
MTSGTRSERVRHAFVERVPVRPERFVFYCSLCSRRCQFNVTNRAQQHFRIAKHDLVQQTGVIQRHRSVALPTLPVVLQKRHLHLCERAARHHMVGVYGTAHPFVGLHRPVAQQTPFIRVDRVQIGGLVDQQLHQRVDHGLEFAQLLKVVCGRVMDERGAQVFGAGALLGGEAGVLEVVGVQPLEDLVAADVREDGFEEGAAFDEDVGLVEVAVSGEGKERTDVKAISMSNVISISPWVGISKIDIFLDFTTNC